MTSGSESYMKGWFRSPPETGLQDGEIRLKFWIMIHKDQEIELCTAFVDDLSFLNTQDQSEDGAYQTVYDRLMQYLGERDPNYPIDQVQVVRYVFPKPGY